MADDGTLFNPCTPHDHNESAPLDLSSFERIFTLNPPIFNNLLSHLPTPAILDLYHTSRFFRDFLRDYPLAWKILSFRLLPTANASNPPIVSGFESPAAQGESRKAYSQDLLLRSVIPYASCLTRLDLDNTAVSGTELYVRVLEPRRHSLQHLSIRGCKEVSLKYHILPYLQFQLALPANDAPFALKSLYTYRCRHHRRRPYLPSSLTRRDSDSQPTHQLIDLCYKLGVWTDTAWCPTPGSRCYRRRDYYSSKLGAIREHEVWVPFDKLWRSQNIVGPSYVWSENQNQDCPFQGTKSRRLWEQDSGWNGEPLGEQLEGVDGKGVPMHLRKNHRIFVRDHRCYKCKEIIPERCEQCSVRMHCMGCRKTLCSSCAFDRPLRRKRRRSTHIDNEVSANENDAPSTNTVSVVDLPAHTTHHKTRSRRSLYWWAPGATRSPNLMHEDPPAGDISSDEDDDGIPTNLTGTPQRPRLEMHWCCLRPCFSGGGGIGFTAPFCGGDIRAAPLPQGRGYEDPAFLPSPEEANDSGTTTSSITTTNSRNRSYQFPYRAGHPQFDILPYVEQPRQSSPSPACPRSLCAPCYNSPTWKVQCPACNNPICIEHEVKTLKARKCGYRNLLTERASVQQTKGLLSKGEAVPKHLASASRSYFHAKWLGIMARMNEADDVRRLNGQWAPNATRRPLGLYSSFHAWEQMAYGQQRQQQQQQQQTMLGYLWDSSSQTTSVGVSDDHPPPFPVRGDQLNQKLQHQPEPSSSPDFSQTTPTPLSRSASTSALAHPGNPTIASDTHGVPPSIALQPTTWYSPLPLQTPWTGCGMLFCPPDRYPGDWRPHCFYLNTNPPTTNHNPTQAQNPPILPCTLCSTNVCSTCRLSNPPCPCTVCSARGYTCPNCANRADVRSACKGVEEEMERRRAESEKEGQRERLRREVRGWWDEQRREREAADESCVGLDRLFAE